MSVPHEYMDFEGDWHLHSKHNSSLYEDHDILAHDSDGQLPLISTIGAGPRGAGLIVQEVAGDPEGTYRLVFINDQTGEAELTTPNLDPGYLEFSWPDHNWQEGEVGHLFISYYKNGGVYQYNVPLPPGAHGSRIYLSAQVFDYRPEDNTYYTSIADLTIYGRPEYKAKPTPRPGDIVVFIYKDSEEKKLAFGTIEAVEDERVVFTSRTALGISALVSGSNPAINGHEITNNTKFGDIEPSYNDLIDKPDIAGMIEDYFKEHTGGDLFLDYITEEEVVQLFKEVIEPYLVVHVIEPLPTKEIDKMFAGTWKA